MKCEFQTDFDNLSPIALLCTMLFVFAFYTHLTPHTCTTASDHAGSSHTQLRAGFVLASLALAFCRRLTRASVLLLPPWRPRGSDFEQSIKARWLCHLLPPHGTLEVGHV